MLKQRYRHIAKLLAILTIAGVLTGCSTSKQAGGVKKSGFLGDYSKLRKGKEGQAQLVDIDRNVNWQSYNKIILKPVAYLGSKRTGDKTSFEDKKRLVNNFWVLLNQKLSPNYKLVRKAEPGTILIEVAITDVDRSEPILDKITTVIPQSLVLTSLKGYVIGKPGFVGEASVEAKFTDAQSGKLLAAGVDRRVGGKRLRKGMSSWDDVNQIMKYWSEQAAYRLCTLRQGRSCIKPKV